MYIRNLKKEDFSETSLSTSVEITKRENCYLKSKKIKKVVKRKYKKRQNDILVLMLSKSKRIKEKNLNLNYCSGLKYESVDKLMNKSGFSLKVKSSCPEFQLLSTLKKKEKVEDNFCDSIVNVRYL